MSFLYLVAPEREHRILRGVKNKEKNFITGAEVDC